MRVSPLFILEAAWVPTPFGLPLDDEGMPFYSTRSGICIHLQFAFHHHLIAKFHHVHLLGYHSYCTSPFFHIQANFLPGNSCKKIILLAITLETRLLWGGCRSWFFLGLKKEGYPHILDVESFWDEDHHKNCRGSVYVVQVWNVVPDVSLKARKTRVA